MSRLSILNDEGSREETPQDCNPRVPSWLLTELARVMANAVRFSWARPPESRPSIGSDLLTRVSPLLPLPTVCCAQSRAKDILGQPKLDHVIRHTILQWLPLHREENSNSLPWPRRFSRLLPPIPSLDVPDSLFCHFAFASSLAATSWHLHPCCSLCQKCLLRPSLRFLFIPPLLRAAPQTPSLRAFHLRCLLGPIRVSPLHCFLPWFFVSVPLELHRGSCLQLSF